MQLDKSQILDLLRSEGRHDQAQQVDAELPQLAGGGLGGLLGR